MERIIRLTESDLTSIVRLVITESFLEKKINDVKIVFCMIRLKINKF